MCRWRAAQPKTINIKDSSLHVLPVEIIQYISATFLPSDAAASLAICSRSMLKIVGSLVLLSLNLKCHAVEKVRFLENLEKDLPDWLLCHYCSVFHPVDQNVDPSQCWRGFEEKECVRANGVVAIGYDFHMRYEHAQMIMRNYRLGRPYEINLEKFSKRFARHQPEKSLESVVRAKIVAGELLLHVKHTLRLLKVWDISLIRTTIPEICPHIYRSPVSSFAQALRCRSSHANRLPCTECKKQDHCLNCSTSFQVDIRTLRNLVIEVQVDVWRCLGSCESPYDTKWRRQANRYLFQP